MISHLFLHQGRESFFILALTSSTGKCDAARVILATFLFSSSAHNSCENSTTASNLVSVPCELAPVRWLASPLVETGPDSQPGTRLAPTPSINGSSQSHWGR